MPTISGVETERVDYKRMKPKWARLRDLFDGRDAILDAGSTYVPNIAGGDAEINKNYRARGNLFNALARTVGGMNGMIYQKPPEVEIAESRRAWLKDVTQSNVPFEVFAVEVGAEIFLTGRYGILIDMPEKTAADNRPFFAGYKAEQIINWRIERRDGDDVLAMVVLAEQIEAPIAPENPFQVDLIPQFRVVKLNLAGQAIQQLWREKTDKSKQFVQFGEDKLLSRRGEALTFIPFIFIGAVSPTPRLRNPPLIDLADINLGHWRNSVDHEYGLHLVSLPTPWVAGSKGGGTDEGIEKKIGPSVVWELDTAGKAGMLEFTGKGLESLANAMEEKKKQMAALGARLLEDAPSTQETATAVRIRHSGETATLKTVAQSQEMGFSMALQVMLWWAGAEKLPQDVTANVELNKEFLDIKASPLEITTALTAVQAGEMSFETWYHMLVTGGWAREGVDVEQEKKDIRERGGGE